MAKAKNKKTTTKDSKGKKVKRLEPEKDMAVEEPKLGKKKEKEREKSELDQAGESISKTVSAKNYNILFLKGNAVDEVEKLDQDNLLSVTYIPSPANPDLVSETIVIIKKQ